MSIKIRGTRKQPREKKKTQDKTGQQALTVKDSGILSSNWPQKICQPRIANYS